jgi:hypothetical protein
VGGSAFEVFEAPNQLRFEDLDGRENSIFDPERKFFDD